MYMATTLSVEVKGERKRERDFREEEEEEDAPQRSNSGWGFRGAGKEEREGRVGGIHGKYIININNLLFLERDSNGQLPIRGLP